MEISDQEAVLKTLSDPNEFTLLVNRYQSPLMRYIRRLGIPDEDIAKDILQESFIKAYTYLNDYSPVHTFSAWMYRITHNETMTYYRKQKNKPIIFQDEIFLRQFEELADSVDIEKNIDRKFDKEIVMKALSVIKPIYRDILILRFFEDKSYDEIADILQIPMGTVATNVARGKVALQKLLKDYTSLAG